VLQLTVLVCAQVQPVVAGSAPVVSQVKVHAVLKELSIEVQVRSADLWNARSDAETSAQQAVELMVRAFLLNARAADAAGCAVCAWSVFGQLCTASVLSEVIGLTFSALCLVTIVLKSPSTSQQAPQATPGLFTLGCSARLPRAPVKATGACHSMIPLQSRAQVATAGSFNLCTAAVPNTRAPLSAQYDWLRARGDPAAEVPGMSRQQVASIDADVACAANVLTQEHTQLLRSKRYVAADEFFAVQRRARGARCGYLPARLPSIKPLLQISCCSHCCQPFWSTVNGLL